MRVPGCPHQSQARQPSVQLCQSDAFTGSVGAQRRQDESDTSNRQLVTSRSAVFFRA